VGIHLVVVDDNPHVSWEGRVHPVNATFQQFVAAMVDLPGSPVASITSCVPLRAATAPPATLPLDDRIRVVGTAPFDGIAGYLRRLPAMMRANRPILREAIGQADLVWLKVPASNAPFAGWLARRAGVPRFGYVAGSALAVARGRGLGVPAQTVGRAYDLAGRLAGGRHRVVVGEGLIDGDGIVTSLVEPEEIRETGTAPSPAIPWRLRLAWAGRLAPGKGLEGLVDALAILAADEKAGDRVELVIIGDGPARGALEARAAGLGIGDRIHWLGYIAERPTYIDALASCDLFVFPSPAEGFPKVILDAMAVGLPVMATGSGQLGSLADGGLVEAVGADDPVALAAAIGRLVASAPLAGRLIAAGHAFATAHTRPAEAARLAVRWQSWWPDLPWGLDVDR
jgi:glycosyltransferase involved in cell wall biosynthesis